MSLLGLTNLGNLFTRAAPAANPAPAPAAAAPAIVAVPAPAERAIVTAQQTIQNLAAEIKGVKGKYNFFSLMSLKIKSFFKELSGSEKAQLEFCTLCSKIGKVRDKFAAIFKTSFDVSSGSATKANNEAKAQAYAELAPLYKQAIEIAAKQATTDSKALFTAEAVKLALAQETSADFVPFIERSSVVTAAGKGHEMTALTLVDTLMNANQHLQEIADTNPDKDMRDIHGQFIGTLVTTPGIHRSIFGALQVLYSNFDAATTAVATDADVASMKGHFNTEVQNLVNGNREITAQSLNDIHYQGISVGQIAGEGLADVVTALEGARVALTELKALKVLQADTQRLTTANDANLVTLRAALAAPRTFTLQDINAFVGAEIINRLVGPDATGKTVEQEIAELTRLSADLAVQTAAKDAAVATATQALNGAKTVADAEVARLTQLVDSKTKTKTTTEEQVKQLKDKIANENKVGVNAGKALTKARAAGDNDEVDRLYKAFGKELNDQRLDETALKAAKALVTTLTAEIATDTAALAAAKTVATTATEQFNTAKTAKETELGGAITALQAKVNAKQIQPYTLTGTQLATVEVMNLGAGKIADAIKAAAATRNAIGKAEATGRELAAVSAEIGRLTEDAINNSTLNRTIFALDRNSLQVTMTAEFTDGVTAKMTESLTDVRRLQAKEQTVFAIAMGKRILAAAAEHSKAQLKAFVAQNAALAAVPMVEEYEPTFKLDAFEAERRTAKAAVFGRDGTQEAVEAPKPADAVVDLTPQPGRMRRLWNWARGNNQ